MNVGGYLGGVTVTAGGQSVTTQAANGWYLLSGLASGSYTVTPSLANYTFSPASQTVNLGPNATVNFTATYTGATYSILGTIKNTTSGSTIMGLTVYAVAGSSTYSGTTSGSASYGQSIAYSIPGVPNGTYTVTPQQVDGLVIIYTPSSATNVLVSGGNATVPVFKATVITKYVSGLVTTSDGTGVPGVTLGAGGHAAVTDAKGYYVLEGMGKGQFTIQPSPQDQAKYRFTPASRDIAITDSSPMTHQDFTATPLSGAAGEGAPAEDSGGASGGSPQAEAAGCPPSDEAAGASAGVQMASAHFARSTWPTHHGGHGPNARFAGAEEADYTASMDAHAESTRSESTPAGPNEFTYFYLWDQVGSVRVVANGQGVTVETHDYEPYGLEMSSAMCPSSSLMRYAGQERDYLTSDCSDTVDYMHYRFYASTTGRFMKPDNVNGNPMNPQSWNLYSYVHGNPVNLNDPTGHMTGGPAPDRTEVHITLWRQNPVEALGTDDWSEGEAAAEEGAVGSGDSVTISSKPLTTSQGSIGGLIPAASDVPEEYRNFTVIYGRDLQKEKPFVKDSVQNLDAAAQAKGYTDGQIHKILAEDRAGLVNALREAPPSAAMITVFHANEEVVALSKGVRIPAREFSDIVARSQSGQPWGPTVLWGCNMMNAGSYLASEYHWSNWTAIGKAYGSLYGEKGIVLWQ